MVNCQNKPVGSVVALTKGRTEGTIAETPVGAVIFSVDVAPPPLKAVSPRYWAVSVYVAADVNRYPGTFTVAMAWPLDASSVADPRTTEPLLKSTTPVGVPAPDTGI